MLNASVRRLWKRTLVQTRIKLIYTRITLTRFTTLYFFFALVTCVVLVILQGVSYADNVQAVTVMSSLLSGVKVTKGLPVFSGGILQICDSIPGHSGGTCATVVTPSKSKSSSPSNINSRGANPKFGKRIGNELNAAVHDDESDDDDPNSDSDDDDEHDDDGAAVQSSTPIKNKENPVKGGEVHGGGLPPQRGAGISQKQLDTGCAYTLLWLDDVLSDAKREDLATLAFHIWSFSLAVITILNESLPHLGAAFAGHILGTAWAGYRVQSTERLRTNYMSLISAGACGGIDLLGNWWEVRRLHAIPTAAVSALALLTTGYLSINLYKTYTTQSFSRVGASPQIHRIYRLVLFLSVSLQLTGFFSVASTAIWIDKISHGNIRFMAGHIKIYLAAFVVTLVLEVPWVVLGWVCVRKESRRWFWVFAALSVFLLTIPTLMFFSPLYRFIFLTWPFFATVTVTAYIFVVATSLLGLWCRLNFGKGLSHFLQVSEALEGVDFTPVYFPTDKEKTFEFPVLFHDSIAGSQAPQPPVQSDRGPRNLRGQSVYSEPGGAPVIMSSTPPLFREEFLTDATAFDLGRNQIDVASHAVPQIPCQSAPLSGRSATSEVSRFEGSKSSSPKLPRGPRSRSPTPF